MRCGFCGLEFDQSEAVVTCKSCPLAKNCHLVCCPRCGYENPPEPKLFRWIREKRRRIQSPHDEKRSRNKDGAYVP